MGADRFGRVSASAPDPGEPARRSRRPRLLTSVLAVGVVAAVAMTGFRSPEGPSPTTRAFAEQPVPLAVDTPYELGVADVNDDGALDLFTANHNSRQAVLVGDGHGGFVDQLTELGLDQNAAFPGWESIGREPERASRGLYLYWFNNRLVIRAEGSGSPVASGRFEVLAPVRIFEDEGFTYSIDEGEEAGWPRTVIEFTAARDGAVLVLQPEFLGVPLSFTIAEDFPLEQVFVGSELLRPAAHEIDLLLDDRHGMAWADFDGDGATDVFITRGGLRGDIADFPRTVHDELFRQEAGRFHEQTSGSGIVKGACRGRGTSWVDVDSDGRLDLFVPCLGSQSRLWRQHEPGRFTDVADELGLAAPQVDSFVWTDLDLDGDIDLVAASRRQLLHFVNDGGTFDAVAVSRTEGTVTQVLVGDHESDGDLDLLAISPDGNTLVVNDAGRFQAVDPDRLGLPKQSRAAAWVDVDNDGLLDLHSIPGGIFRQAASGRFERTGLLAAEVPDSLSDAWVAWPDVNNDGYRDPVMLFLGSNRRDPGSATLHHGMPGDNHWLEIQLIGPRGNRAAIGARAEVQTPDGTLVIPVGSSDSSRYSQGHYRLYAGLGRHTSAAHVTVVWPDGSRQELADVAGDQILRIAMEG